MYVSLVLVYIGEAGLLAQIWPLILLPFIIMYLNLIVIPLEETRLKEVFGEKYEQYCLLVSRWF